MIVRSLAILVALGLGGCANSIRIDEVRGGTIIPQGRIAVLGMDRPGTASAGLSIALRKPSAVEWSDPSGDSLVRGRREWAFPRWNLQTHAAWTPWEGVTIVPSMTMGEVPSGWIGASSLGLGLHAHLDRFAWQIEGRGGVAWFRSRTRRRTSITDIASAEGVHLDSAVTDPLAGLSMTTQLGLQFETDFPRQPFQLWSTGRWGLWNSTILSDARNDALALSLLQEWSGGVGIHRRIGRAHTISAGVLASWATASWPGNGGAASTTLLVQWESAFGGRGSRADGSEPAP